MRSCRASRTTWASSSTGPERDLLRVRCRSRKSASTPPDRHFRRVAHATRRAPASSGLRAGADRQAAAQGLPHPHRHGRPPRPHRAVLRPPRRHGRRVHAPGAVRADGDRPPGLLAESGLIWVSGGNTANMLAVWRVHGVDRVLREAWDAGVILCGGSAGSLCWFECGTTNSFDVNQLAPLHDGLGFLPGSHCPHYDGEAQRRPLYHRLVAEGFPAGYADRRRRGGPLRGRGGGGGGQRAQRRHRLPRRAARRRGGGDGARRQTARACRSASTVRCPRGPDLTTPSRGHRRGRELPVFDLDFGRVGCRSASTSASRTPTETGTTLWPPRPPSRHRC